MCRVSGFGLWLEGLGLGFRASTCAGLSIHAPMAPPHFQGSVVAAARG